MAKRKHITKRNATVLNRPLAPGRLKEWGFVDAVPEPGGPFDPAGEWSHTYAIRTSSGFLEFGLNERGTLAIERKRRGDNLAILVVKQTLVGADNKSATTDAEIVCRTDRLATPVSWRMTQTVETPDGLQKHAPPLKASGQAGAKEIRIASACAPRAHTLEHPPALDWCLFDAVQRWPEDQADDGPVAFDLVETGRLVKPGQTLRDRGIETVTWGDRTVKLRRLSQTGRGILPVDYWLDGNRRLVFVTGGNRAYALR